ncbi:ABC transporter ATP-binding protein [Marinilactibacillus psychrotolerans]|uniref:Multidrug ABC transporter ATP-binding and permease protein n=1 Tax=Marinilactibacillus psychrotolerans TaxID=191770 RepID=A0AAV3WR40_9LACT|nr:ABC transporter ATP-binding protein [Marinilactibacillus psychrotolerans]GEL67384.1 ABC transporter ATP-binding protein [Marinilactibacillus psychrotolerans]GEQ36379.1 multidrug ABC transporter ATP-binding and permease protein [Marinilactibacillus psychrotolerans]SDD00232.1 ATP-binding cassette, subfamily B [Marinilactibacillus psychrotolerans]
MDNSSKGTTNQENSYNFKEILSNVNQYAGQYKLPFLLSVIFAALGSVATIIGPDKLKEITNLITEGIGTGIDLEQINRIAITLVILYLLGSILSYAQGFIVATITQKFSKRLRKEISVKINKLPLKYFDSHSQGDVLSRVTNDLDTVGQSLNQSLGILVSAIALFIGCLFMMFKTNVIMSFSAIGSVLIGFLLMTLIMKKSQVYFKGQQSKLAKVNGFVEEAYSGHNTIYSYNAKNDTIEEFADLNADLYTSVWKSQFLSGLMQPLMAFIGNFGYVVVCVVGAVLVINDSITFGVIVAFTVYVRLFSQPLGQMAQAFSGLQRAQAAMGRVFEFLNENEMQDEVNKKQQLIQKTQGYVEFDHVSFGYEEDQTIIDDFSTTALPGQKIAIVGPTGAGKTTIVNLLMKFYEVNEGRILIDHIDISDMTRDEVHNQFCMVLQDTWLFEGTVKENLIYNQKNISDEKVVEAAVAVGIDHFIKTLPQGYDTVLDDRVSLSVGQKQLLTIARALVKDSPMLILDEATSSVDTRTEELIQAAMDRLMEGRTSFVIAHRLSTIQNADTILVMKDGAIIESGNHETLMNDQGFYSDLYNSQFEK